MKIARNLPVSHRHDEWERLNIQSFVGAMKIARNLPVSNRWGKWHPPSVGAATSRPQPEGFSMLG